ncbi:PVC-type heme-binding CxxCH protein [Rhodopirellula sp. MGV]|uniref:PVC-type heme-binding CxxCH protein n=1 Tax=Rhodopirellula sp. MGV TaxID=2023130 RepID=UPI000B96B7FA|nr:PVC-type heme-binding CxxCH protein [Rhodopirellula sp. MGV]OYP36740.1 hypothetical protein CGZ80_07515 [Rhodopirellula sp. MGV]PNY34433.1 hypothetical protein C2E31_23585 [Rhodopirellula baltica]
MSYSPRFKRFRLALALLTISPLTLFANQCHGQQSGDGFPSLQYRAWSGSINVPDPVAVSVANDGTVYVTQTQRRKIQDLDIRANTDWIPNDVGFQSVEDKRAFYHERLAIDGDDREAARHVGDVNRDGRHDWRDLTVISERIHRLADRDGDGTADETNVFAEGFQTEVTGIAAGVLHHEDSVYATIAPDVWKLVDRDGDHVADERSIVATGFGLHIAYAGHDMHGLAIGPDGKLYWSIGDKGISVTTAEGKRILYPNQGGVMRCSLDGSDFEVFAHGLRNVQEFAFDSYGNIFGIDNDSDQPGERERFVWIVDQMDAGWRCNYQYRSGKYNPWTEEKLWETASDEHPAYIVPPISYYVDGPAGFKVNPGAALSTAYRDFFFMTSAPNGRQFAFRVEPNGDSYRMVDDHEIGSGVPIVGIAFGPDGGLYGADWGGGYPLTQTGSVQRIDVPADQLTDSERQDRESVIKWLNEDLSAIETSALVESLAHIDVRVRQRLQFELVRRNAGDRLVKLANDPTANQLARVHAIWGVGQLIRQGKLTTATIKNLLQDKDAKIRLVAIKVLGESNHDVPEDFVVALADKDPHVLVHAALALGRSPTPAGFETLINLADRTEFENHYLRHAIATGLTRCATPGELTSKVAGHSEVARLCAVVALRRMHSPLVAAYLADPSMHVATEAARAIHDDFSIDEALPGLAATLKQARPLSEGLARRAINANLRLGDAESAARVLRFAADGSQSESLRADACDAIAAWIKPPVLDRVDGRRRDVSAERSFDKTDVTEALVALIQDSPVEVRVAAAKAARELKITLSADALTALASDRTTPTGLRLEATQMIGEFDVLATLSRDPSDAIAKAAITTAVELDPARSLPVLEDRLRHAKFPVKQVVVNLLAAMHSDRANALLAELGQQWLNGDLPSELQLDVYAALSGEGEPDSIQSHLFEQINATETLAKLPSEKLRRFALARDGGDATEGERIFKTDLRAQCSRCHQIGRNGSNIGPELTHIAKQRDADYLLRAVVYPSADIEAKYNVQTVLLSDGNVVQGVLKSEDDDYLVLIDAKGKKLKLAQDDIEQVADKKVSLMPDMTDVLSAQEVRDLVAYLRSRR